MHNIKKFEHDQDRFAGLDAMRARMSRSDSLVARYLADAESLPPWTVGQRPTDVDTILLRATPRPTMRRGPSGMQIAVTVALALALGLSLGVLAERAWAEAIAVEVQG